MIAYGPLAMILLGTRAASKVVLIIVAVSYTVLVNALAGLRDCDPGIVAMLRSLGRATARSCSSCASPVLFRRSSRA